jgi:thiol-disulfide isomerase/thioredoxin
MKTLTKTCVRVLGVVATALLMSCAKAPPPAPATPALVATVHKHADAPGIDWYEGEVDGAFSAAKSARKPILLYWGAKWCPPCQQLKATVFSRPDFIAKSRLFVPVYLDGDGAGAQKWGETFQVSGYPTLVVLDAERHELMRIAGGMDLALYAGVLDTALADLQPVDALLTTGSSGAALNLGQCRRLALNGWEPDLGGDSAGNAKLAKQLNDAAEHCPADAQVERARLHIFAAGYATEAEGDDLKAGKPPSAALRAHVDAVGLVLSKEAIALRATDALESLDENFFRAVKGGGASAQAWLARYTKVMDAAAIDPDFAEADQLGAIGAKLTAIKVIQGAVPAGVARAASARVSAALAGSQIPYVRSGIINAVLPIYDVLGQNEVAYKVVQGELSKTATPYYYKADLGDLAEGLGRKDEALKWFSEGYAEAQGPATRFQWGSFYAAGLLRLDPNDPDKILSVTGQVLGELDGPDRIYRRARMRLARLDKSLRKWNTDTGNAHHAVIVGLRERMQQICVKIPQSEPARASCDAFLASA